MKKILNLTLLLGLTLMLGACSSSKTTENTENSELTDQLPPVDAATDAVPQASAENVTSTPDAVPTQADPMQTDTQQATASTEAPAGTTAQADTTQADAGVVTPSPAGSGNFDEYAVQEGDTLMKIAFETYGDLYRWKGILEANRDKVTDPNHIPAGTVLKVEKPATPVTVEKNGEKYLIKTGDTLGTISQEVYGTKSKWRKLWDNNKQLIHDPNRIFAGFYLYYQPESEVTPAPMADATQTQQAPAATTTERAPAAASAPAAPAAPATDGGAAPASATAPATGAAPTAGG